MSELCTSSAHAAREVVAVRVKLSAASFACTFDLRDGQAQSSVVRASEVRVFEAMCLSVRIVTSHFEDCFPAHDRVRACAEAGTSVK